MPKQNRDQLMTKAEFHGFLDAVLGAMKPSTLATIIAEIDDLAEMAPLDSTTGMWRETVHRFLVKMVGPDEADKLIHLAMQEV